MRTALLTCSSVTSSEPSPYLTLESTVPLNMNAFWGTYPILSLRSWSLYSRTSTPSTRTCPSVAS